MDGLEEGVDVGVDGEEFFHDFEDLGRGLTVGVGKWEGFGGGLWGGP